MEVDIGFVFVSKFKEKARKEVRKRANLDDCERMKVEINLLWFSSFQCYVVFGPPLLVYNPLFSSPKFVPNFLLVAQHINDVNKKLGVLGNKKRNINIYIYVSHCIMDY